MMTAPSSDMGVHGKPPASSRPFQSTTAPSLPDGFDGVEGGGWMAPAWKVWRMFYQSEPRIVAGQTGVLA